MKLKQIFKISIIGLRTHKTRSILTILGIVIGITAIILIASIGLGAENLILDQISGLGAEAIIIRPGREPKGPADFPQTIFADSLKIKDVGALQNKSNVPGLIAIAPAVIVTGNVSYKGETFRPMIFGWSAELMADMFKIYPEEGALFDDADIKRKANVVVIGSKVKTELFKDEEALGKNIKIKDKNFRVIGIFPPKGQTSFLNVDELVILPYTTAQTYLLGSDHFNEIITKAENPEAVKRTVKDIKMTLREMHNITDPEKDDFFIVTQEGVVKQIETIINILTIFLSSVMAISLIVGGIGVMNIMLVSVTERTKEIGLRKAVGATNKDILLQFLLEAIILTLTGGIIGIILGTTFSFAISIIITNFFNIAWPFVFPFLASFLGLGVAVLVGLIFGIYPARQASFKNPIEALRYE